MATHISTIELRKMQPQELRKEIETKRIDVAKMRLQVQMRSQKDTAKFQREKREFARMLTVLNDLENGVTNALQPAPKRSKVLAPASAKSASADKAGSVSSSR